MVCDRSNELADFYAPPVVAAALIALRKLADVTAVPLGGYPQAERCRLCLGNADALTGAAAEPAEVPLHTMKYESTTESTRKRISKYYRI